MRSRISDSDLEAPMMFQAENNVLDLLNINPGQQGKNNPDPVVVTTVWVNAVQNGTITVYFDGTPMGNPLQVTDPSVFVFDVPIPIGTVKLGTYQKVYYTVDDHSGSGPVTSPSIPLTVINTMSSYLPTGMHQSRFYGQYEVSCLDSWSIPGPYTLQQENLFIESIDGIPSNNPVSLSVDYLSKDGNTSSQVGILTFDGSLWNVVVEPISLIRGDSLSISLTGTGPQFLSCSVTL